MTVVDVSASERPAYRYLWELHRFRRKRQLINLGGVFVGWTARLLPGVAAKVVFDRISAGTIDAALGWLWWPVALMTVRMFIGVGTAFVLQRTNGAFAFANAAMMQRNVLRHVLRLPGATALRYSPGETVSRLRDDTESVIWYPIGFNNVIGSFFAGTIALVALWQISPVITLGVFVPLFIVVAIVELARARLVAYRRANQIRTAEVAGFIGDVFAAAQSIQLGNAQARTVERFRTLNARRRRAAVRDRMLEEFLKSAFWVVNLGTGLVLIFAGRSLESGEFTVGSFALFVYLLTVFTDFIADIGGGLAGYQHQRVSFGRLESLMDGDDDADLVARDEIHERGDLPSARPTLATRHPLDHLSVRGLTYHYDSRSARGIADIDLDIPRGSFTVVVGRVGSGKSTMLKSVLGLLPAHGEVRWNGELVDTSEFMRPPHAAYTPQVPRLFSDTLAENIHLGHDGDLDAAFRAAVMDDDLADFHDGVDTMLGSRGVRLSGGQLQRTAAARMFLRDSELIVCDDLSSALDVRTEATLWERVATGRNATVLAVSHRRPALIRADQVVVLVDGRVDDVGPVDDLLRRNGEMQRLWQLDADA